MALELKFFVKEHIDGRSFVILDTTGDYDAEDNEGGWGTPNPSQSDITSAVLDIAEIKDANPVFETQYTLSSGGEYFSEDEVSVQDISYPKDRFNDSIYRLRITATTASDTYTTEWYYFGFASIIAGEVMRTSLDYHPSESKQKKEWILEQQRLLTNLRYSAETGNLQYFDENLLQLQKIR